MLYISSMCASSPISWMLLSISWAAGGMPDLLLWCPRQKKAKLSEVKGPRDSLSSQQRAWIAALLAGGLDCEVHAVPCCAVWLLSGTSAERECMCGTCSTFTCDKGRQLSGDCMSRCSRWWSLAPSSAKHAAGSRQLYNVPEPPVFIAWRQAPFGPQLGCSYALQLRGAVCRKAIAQGMLPRHLQVIAFAARSGLSTCLLACLS